MVEALPETRPSDAERVRRVSPVPAGYRCRTYRPRTARASTIEAMADLVHALRAERLPDDPPIPIGFLVHRYRNFPTDFDVTGWMIRPVGEDAVIADVLAVMPSDQNQHLVQMWLDVHPEHRRRGIGRHLLHHVVRAARTSGRRLIMLSTSARVPAGAAFAQAMGATPGVEAAIHQLEVSAVPLDRVRAWRDRGRRLSDYHLELWEGAWPEEELEAMCRVFEAMNDEPRGSLQLDDERWTPQRIRDFERFRMSPTTSRWTLVVRARAGDVPVGFTELVLDDARPTIAEQETTVVVPAHRGHGLGTWLKAEMLDRLMREGPQVRFVRTGMADANAPMRSINERLGFALYSAITAWQVAVEDAERYLSAGRKP
jgi:mycothiol synthase